MNWTAIVWVALVALFLFMESTTVTLVSLWFAAGALGAMIVALLGGPIWLQLAVFIALSAILLTALRPLVRKYIKPRISATNVDALIGSQGYVTVAVDNLAAAGQVKLGAMPWTARSSDGSPIPEGTLVRVERIEGVKAYVTPVKETANVI